MRQKFNLITLGVSDVKKSTEFFEKLGWKKSSASMEEMVFFPLGGMVLGLHPRHELAQDANVSEKGSGFPGITISYNAKDEKEVDTVLKEAEKAGATIIKPAQKVYWGGYSGYFKDRDGFLFEVAFNLYWELDENDNVILPA
jgi:hypothetical protein